MGGPYRVAKLVDWADGISGQVEVAQIAALRPVLTHSPPRERRE